MTNMAQTEASMFESVTAKTKNLPSLSKQERPKRECRARKRPYDAEFYTSKRLKCDGADADEQQIDGACTFALTGSDSEEDNDTESKCSTSDETEQALIKQVDDNSDVEDVEDETASVNFAKVSSDQNRHFPVVLNQTAIHQQQQSLSRQSKRLISQFKYLYDHGLRKSVQPTNGPDLSSASNGEVQSEKVRWELGNTFNRLDLFKEGYCVLSNEPFPFHSLCYMCGSMGSDLLYCTSCCEAYHPSCLNEYERPRSSSVSECWLCPNCNVCNICGLLTHPNFLSRMAHEQSQSPQLISCFDCKRNFHVKCIKRLKDDQWHELQALNNTNNANQNSIISLSRLSHSYLLNQVWFCPSCVRCDCGQALVSNERNILSLTKTYASQQALMCFDCLTNIKLIRTEKNENIEKCHLCEKFIEQIYSKQQQQISTFLQCNKCKHRFHPKCDGYLDEDAVILPQMKSLCFKVICSKCDSDERGRIKRRLLEYKLQAIEAILASLLAILQRIIADPSSFDKLQASISSLQQLHESRHQSLNLHTFLNDLLSMIRRLHSHHDIHRWQAVIDGCIVRQCPWFKSVSLLHKKKLSHQPLPINTRCLQPPPSSDHTYAATSEHTTRETASDSLLHCLESDAADKDSPFTNLYETDRRKCQICETCSDHRQSNIGRLISFGVDQWVHAGCILPAYAKNLDQPPYILRNIRETVLRCQTKYTCSLCSKLGASVHCCENECYQRFHCDCIQRYYAAVDKTIVQQLNLKNGFLPNLTTICLRHNGLRKMNDIHRESVEGANADSNKEPLNNNAANLARFKYVNISSTVYGDLSNNTVEFPLADTRLCIGSLQIESLGSFDYQIHRSDDELCPTENYPHDYRASRLFWSMTNPRRKTVYHLRIDVEQTYHEDQMNHRTVQHPMTAEKLHVQELYDRCQEYFTKFQKTIDEHLSSIEELCQRTSVNKKGLSGQSNYKKKAAMVGIGTTKRLPKATTSCVKRQTPKAALKNVSRPRNRFANESNPQIKQQPLPKDNKDVKNNDIQNLFNADYFKTANVSQLALALVQAFRQVGQSAKIQQDSSSNHHVPEQLNHSMNGATSEKSNDNLLKQLLKNITVPHQVHDLQLQPPNASQLAAHPTQWRTTISIQSESNSLPKSPDDLIFNNHLQLACSSANNSRASNHTTNEPSMLFPKPACIPQLDGAIDDVTDDDLLVSSTVINALIEQIADLADDSSMDVSDCVGSPSAVQCPPPPVDEGEKVSLPSLELIRSYKQWAKLNFCRVKFTITNDEGYQIVSEDLDDAWLTIIDAIRSCRDDQNLPHLPMTSDELSGHKVFGLTRPIIKVMLNQMYSTQQTTGATVLPLSSSGANNAVNSYESYSKKSLSSSASRSNVYERKMRERHRFGWLLNQSRKIDYALKSFEIDDALAHARRILLAEASVSLRLYHLHYFSSRALLVGSSPIHGCGLFTLVDLVEGQMICEYSGEVVRPCLTDKRERENEGKGFGCYMFTVDSMNVIDATHRGNKARFINHNCEPNCFAKTVLSGGAKHIVIYALTDIPRGSELTYDYSFPEEDVKIACHCGSSKCRIYLN